MKTIDDYNFNSDIEDGEKGEKIIVKLLEDYGYRLLNDNKNNKYDLRMLTNKKTETTLEVKTDVYCQPQRDTGNMFIEFECRGKASGLAVTKAKWFVTYYPYLNESWFIKTSDLKELIDNNDFYVVTGGDKGSNTKGYLIRRSKFKEHFTVKDVNVLWEN